jgi:hypothetical protein
MAASLSLSRGFKHMVMDNLPKEGEQEVSENNSITYTPDPNWMGIFRAGAISAFALVIGYLVIIALYIPVFPFPNEGQAMLEYLNGKTAVWWAIIYLSALTDFLYALIAFSLYQALKGINRNVMVIAVGLKWLFVVLELATGWPNYATLITLSKSYAAASSELQRAAYIAAANYSTAMLNSTILKVYAILVPALGTLLIGLVMRKGIFNKATAYLGIVAGVLGIVSVVGPLFTNALDATIILTSFLSMVWFFLVGLRLFKIRRP